MSSTSIGTFPSICAASVWKKICAGVGEREGDGERKKTTKDVTEYEASVARKTNGETTHAHLLLPAKGADFFQWLQDTDFVVEGHDRHDGGVRPKACLERGKELEREIKRFKYYISDEYNP